MSELSQPGVFTIDPQRALELMGEHLLPSKNHALLLWVQSAVLLGAGRIEFTVGRMGLSLAFVPQREIPELDLAREIVGAGDEAFKLLSLGIRVACRGIGRVTLETERLSQTFCKDGAWLESATGKPGLLLKVNRFRWDVSEEVRLLQRSCRWTPIPVLVNGKDVRAQVWGDERTHTQSYLAGTGLSVPGVSLAKHPPRIPAESLGQRLDCRAALSLNQHDQQSRLHWVRFGVVINTEETDLGVHGIDAVLAADDLSTDISGFSLSQGEVKDKRIEEIRVEALAMTKERSNAP